MHSQALKDLLIPLPPLSTQKRIAEILDAADALRRKDQELLKKYDALAQAIFIDMFGDPVKNEKGFTLLKGNEIFKFSSGKFNPTKNLSNDFDYPVYGGNGITGYSSSFLIDFDTIIIGRVGAYCGSIHFSKGKAWITDNAIFIKEIKKTVNLTYAYFLFKDYNFNRFADFSGQPKITQQPLENMDFLYPPIEIQIEFENRVNSSIQQKQKVDFASITSESLFHSLLQQAFNGEL
jgi:type I restriction enzyme S subunit